MGTLKLMLQLRIFVSSQQWPSEHSLRLADGRVEGEQPKFASFLRWCSHGVVIGKVPSGCSERHRHVGDHTFQHRRQCRHFHQC